MVTTEIRKMLGELVEVSKESNTKLSELVTAITEEYQKTVKEDTSIEERIEYFVRNELIKVKEREEERNIIILLTYYKMRYEAGRSIDFNLFIQQVSEQIGVLYKQTLYKVSFLAYAIAYYVEVASNDLTLIMFYKQSHRKNKYADIFEYFYQHYMAFW